MAKRTNYFQERERRQMRRLGMKDIRSGATEAQKGDGGCGHLCCESKATTLKINGRIVTGTISLTWRVLSYLEKAAQDTGAIPCVLLDFADRSIEGCGGEQREKTYIAFPVEYLRQLPAILAEHNRYCMPKE